MDRIEMGDFYIIRLIEVARLLLKERNEWINKYGDLPYDVEIPRMPEFYKNYLGVKRTITAAMNRRRQHRKNVSEIWRDYNEWVIEEQERKNADCYNEESE
jgi:hypothetical protein